MKRNHYLFQSIITCSLSIFITAAKPSKQFTKSKEYLLKEIQSHAKGKGSQGFKGIFWQKRSNKAFTKQFNDYLHSFPFEDGEANIDSIILQHGSDSFELNDDILSQCTGWSKVIESLTEESNTALENFSPTHTRLVSEAKAELYEQKSKLIKHRAKELTKQSMLSFTDYLDHHIQGLDQFASQLDIFNELIDQIDDLDKVYLDLDNIERIEAFLAHRQARIQADSADMTDEVWKHFKAKYQKENTHNLFNFKKVSYKVKKTHLERISEKLDEVIAKDLDANRIILEAKVAESYKTIDYRAATAYLRRQLNLEQEPRNPHPSSEILASTSCLICNDDAQSCSSTMLHPFSCSHSLCNQCLQDLIKLRSNEIAPLTCPIPSCTKPAKLEDLLANQLISDFLHARFNFAIVRKAASLSPGWMPCKTPNCEGGCIKPKKSRTTRYTCELCNHNQCMNCKEDHNQFTTCAEYQEMKDHIDDPLYLSRKKNLVKDCPNCKVPISKAEGCLHMTCGHCKHEFNWETLKPWKGSDWYRLQNGNNIDSGVDTGREESQLIR